MCVWCGLRYSFKCSNMNEILSFQSFTLISVIYCWLHHLWQSWKVKTVPFTPLDWAGLLHDCFYVLLESDTSECYCIFSTVSVKQRFLLKSACAQSVIPTGAFVFLGHSNFSWTALVRSDKSKAVSALFVHINLIYLKLCQLKLLVLMKFKSLMQLPAKS